MVLIKKEIELSAIENTPETLPQIRCMACYITLKPALYQVTPEEWRQAAHQVGWRQVEIKGQLLQSVCPHCVDKLDNSASR